MTWSVNCSAATPPSGTATRNAHSRRQHPFVLKSNPLPDKLPVSDCHLREFCGSNSSVLHDFKGTVITSESQPLKERISIQPADFLNYLLDGLSTGLRNLRHPSTIPGTSLGSKVYALGLRPGLVAILVFAQWTITLVLLWSSYTNFGKKAYQLFLKDEILLFDPTDTVDPAGTEEAVRQMGKVQPKTKPSFSYYIANLLLILSTATYERDDNLVKAASKIMTDIDDDDEKAKAAALLQASEKTIDNMAQLLGMRFMGVSELKSLGGPYAGLFYDDAMIILVYKGTSVLAFNEYLIDGTIQRVDASEFLYGEVHKGFYESLFPDPIPSDCYDRATYNRTNPFNTIMETIFDLAKQIKAKTGKPANLWITGHSLGGALAALTVARLQLPLCVDDPLFEGCDPAAIKIHNSDGSQRTVLQEMLARFNVSYSSSHSSSSSFNVASSSSTPTLSASTTSSSLTSPFNIFHGQHEHSSGHHNHILHQTVQDIKNIITGGDNGAEDEFLLLRDCYSFASPKIGDTAFSQEFDRHHTEYLRLNAYKPVYYRVIVNKDIIPRMPPSCSTDPDDHRVRMFPCAKCARPSSGVDESTEPLNPQHQKSQPVSYGAVDKRKTKDTAKSSSLLPTTAASAESATTNTQPPPLHSLLDYRHVGQMVSLPNESIPPTVKPSEFQTNLSGNVLRTDENMKALLHQIEIALQVSDATATAATGNQGSAPSSSSSSFNAQKIAEEIERAKLRHDLDENSRLRVPCDAEKFLLTFPNVISHSPAAYQRNLVRSRYFFTSFPGTELDNLIQQALVEQQKAIQQQERIQKESVVRVVQMEDLGEMIQVERQNQHLQKLKGHEHVAVTVL